MLSQGSSRIKIDNYADQTFKRWVYKILDHQIVPYSPDQKQLYPMLRSRHSTRCACPKYSRHA